MVTMTFKWKLLEASNMMPPFFSRSLFPVPTSALPFSFFLILISLGLLFILFLKIYYRVVIREDQIFITKISSF
jgi:hypothetical protein